MHLLVQSCARLPFLLSCVLGLTTAIVLAEEPGRHSTTPITDERAVSFELDVQPILTKAGCNSGACHGKQRGQNGFQLSLLAFDSDFDFDAITREARGRRIFHASPARSLLLAKATADLPHGGGRRFDVESGDYQTLLRWIEQGHLRRRTDEPKLLQVELSQTDFAIPVEGKCQLQVTAFYSDGSTRDVTQAATYLSNDEPVARVGEDGGVKAGKLPGETAIMARYMNQICVANVVIPREHTFAPEAYDRLPTNNFIDRLAWDKLKKTGVLPSEPADDSQFLRRAYTDIIGRFPSHEEAEEFLACSASDKRALLIESLLERPEYVDHWSNYWADLLRPNPYRVGIKAVLNYDNWIRQQFRDNVSYDAFVTKLVTAKGSTWRNGAVTLFRDRRSPDEMATLVSQLFLGVRLECAKCHHHPFEKWSQADFYQFAAFFADVKHKGTGLSPPISGGEETVFDATGGKVRHPISGEVLSAKPLYGDIPANADSSKELREQLARWITEPENSYFAKVQANRIWATMMGRGLVEPVDDLRMTNPPSNPALLDALAQEFTKSGFNQKHLIKTIAASHLYSLSSTPNETNVGDRLNYSRHFRHRFRAEVLLDSVDQITETRSKFRGLPGASRSNQIWTHRVSSVFLDTFGRPDPNQDPPCERTSDSTVTQALHLMNSPEIEARIRSKDSRAARLANSGMTPESILDELYLSIYSRHPSQEELEYGRTVLASSVGTDAEQQDTKRLQGTIQDIMWAMLNTPECSIQN